MWSMLFPIVSSILDRVLPGDDSTTRQKKLEIQLELQKAVTEVNSKQLEVNANEAKHSSLFVAGWRPFVGWVCGLGLAVVAFKPILDWVLILLGLPIIPLPNNEDLTLVLYGMLGLGGLRTFDKFKNTDTKIINGWRNPDAK